MTIAELTNAVRKQGFGANYLKMSGGDVRFMIRDADRKNGVTLIFPFQSLEEPKLPEMLIELYLNEVRRRRRRRLGRRT